MSYASKTSVPISRSQTEIEAIVRKAGATSFYRGDDGAKAVIGFQMNERKIMFELPLHSEERSQLAQDQDLRSRWRALVLCVKAKLVSVESGVESFEEAFLAHIVVPNGGRAERFSRMAIEAIASAYSGKSKQLMLGDGL